MAKLAHTDEVNKTQLANYRRKGGCEKFVEQVWTNWKEDRKNGSLLILQLKDKCKEREKERKLHSPKNRPFAEVANSTQQSFHKLTI